MDILSSLSPYAPHILGAVNLLLILAALHRLSRQESAREEERTNFALLEKGQERLEKAVRDELAIIRREASEQGRQDRTEQKDSIKSFGEGIEKKLAETLARVGDQMGQIGRNLGEMSQVAASVSDLKRVMTASASRGSWGEARLEAILEDSLAPTQYVKNAQGPQGSERVEFAVLLPGGDAGPIQLPVDSKFPMESYQRLTQAQEKGDAPMATEAGKALEADIRKQAKKIQKYVNPPATTDFALMFLPSEGLYLEALRRPGLLDLARRESKVAIVGPSTITAFLMSLRMGFATLAIQEKSLEVWDLLAAIRKEFERFGERLDKAKDRTRLAGEALDELSTSVRQMEKKLKRLDMPGQGGGEGGAASIPN